jgi:hypothetical protein
MDPARKDSNAVSPPLPPDFVFLPNAHDQFAVAKLRSAPIGKLAIDRLIQDDPQLAAKLREALIQVYLNAAQTRELHKATKRQIGHARSAHKHLTHVLTHLEAVSTDGRDVVLDQDIGAAGVIVIDNGGTANEPGHFTVSLSAPLSRHKSVRTPDQRLDGHMALSVAEPIAG